MTVTDSAIAKLKQMILTGELRPGDRLPREADLAERLALSRNSLREAVRALSLIRVLDVRQGDGTYVTSLSPKLLLDALAFVVDFHRDDTVLHFLQVRRIIEPATTALAAINMTGESLTRLEAATEDITPDTEVEELVVLDLEFHRLIAEGSGNPILCSLVENLSGPTHRARVWRGLTQEAAVARTLHEHRAILGAIGSRQPDLASSWSTVHVAGVEQWLRDVLIPAGHRSPAGDHAVRFDATPDPAG